MTGLACVGASVGGFGGRGRRRGRRLILLSAGRSSERHCDREEKRKQKNVADLHSSPPPGHGYAARRQILTQHFLRRNIYLTSCYDVCDAGHKSLYRHHICKQSRIIRESRMAKVFRIAHLGVNDIFDGRRGSHLHFDPADLYSPSGSLPSSSRDNCEQTNQRVGARRRPKFPLKRNGLRRSRIRLGILPNKTGKDKQEPEDFRGWLAVFLSAS